MPTRQNKYFLPGEGIRREVITADICRYLGNDALVKPGEYEGRNGYWVTAYRALTSDMIADLKADSLRWAAESAQVDPRNVAAVPYRDSQTHNYRQQFGPSSSQPHTGKPPVSQQGHMDSRGATAPGYGHYQEYPPQAGQGYPGQYPPPGAAYQGHEYTNPTPDYPYGSGGNNYPANSQPRTVPYSGYPGQQPTGEGAYSQAPEGQTYYQSSSNMPRGGNPPQQQQPPRGDPYARGGYQH
ncbi:MAG: diphthine synthase [Watsoniomyces obsoletus]|nr:MAG: diphthine synthase [Watsoniomyces obsoletus]